MSRTILPVWLVWTGYASAALIATGIVIPVLDAAGLTNFAGYVLWCVWLLGVGFLLLKVRDPRSLAVPSRG